MRFFFYGTLLAGSDNPVARAVHARLEPLGPASVHGALYAIPDPLGWYPALVTGDAATHRDLVHGMAYATRSGFSPADLAQLDAYEDCDPADRASSLYWREPLPLVGGGQAEAYVFDRLLPDGALPIPSGDFRDWLSAKGLPAFRGAAAT